MKLQKLVFSSFRRPALRSWSNTIGLLRNHIVCQWGYDNMLPFLSTAFTASSKSFFEKISCYLLFFSYPSIDPVPTLPASARLKFFYLFFLVLFLVRIGMHISCWKWVFLIFVIPSQVIRIFLCHRYLQYLWFLIKPFLQDAFNIAL